jgi:DNA-binding transcriptional regulator YiaG
LGCVHRRIPIKNVPNTAPCKPFPTVIKTLGDQLCFARLQQQISQRNLAKKLHVDVRTLIAWENDRALPSARHIQMIQRELATSLRT